MLTIDTTVVNIALPSIRADLGSSPAGLARVVNAYTLTAGGFLLLGGRIADLISRKRLFLIGVVIFAGASLASGLAQNPATMVTARFAQGLGVAAASPAALSLAVLMSPTRGSGRRQSEYRAGYPGRRHLRRGHRGRGNQRARLAVDFLINLPIAAVVLLSARLIQTSVPPAGRGPTSWAPC